MNPVETGSSIDTGIILRRLSQYADLSAGDLSILDNIGTHTDKVPTGSELLADGEPLTRPRVLIVGWGCRYRVLSDGRRQIFDFILPGDVYGFSIRPHAIALTGAVSLTPCTIADASAMGEALLNHPQSHPGLMAAYAAVASLNDVWLLNQLMRVGRQTAYERLAHLFLEIIYRFDAVGLANGNRATMPLTQETIADAMGLSVVHLNRTLQQLRRDRLIEFRNGIVKLLQPDKLAVIGDFRKPHVVRRETVN